MYTFGFGADHNASMLEGISTQGGGVYYFIDSNEKVSFSSVHAVLYSNGKLSFTIYHYFNFFLSPTIEKIKPAFCNKPIMLKQNNTPFNFMSIYFYRYNIKQKWCTF